MNGRLELDRGRAELRGPADAVWALLDGRNSDDRALPPLLAAGLRAARHPVARLALTGLPDRLEGFADAHAAALLLPLDGRRLALRACTPSGLVGVLVRAVGLGPRPRRPHAPALTLPAERLASVLSESSAAAAGLLGTSRSPCRPTSMRCAPTGASSCLDRATAVGRSAGISRCSTPPAGCERSRSATQAA